MTPRPPAAERSPPGGKSKAGKSKAGRSKAGEREEGDLRRYEALRQRIARHEDKLPDDVRRQLAPVTRGGGALRGAPAAIAAVVSRLWHAAAPSFERIIDHSPWVLTALQGLLHVLICAVALGKTCVSRDKSYEDTIGCISKFVVAALAELAQESQFAAAMGVAYAVGTPDSWLDVWRKAVDTVFPVLSRIAPCFGWLGKTSVVIFNMYQTGRMRLAGAELAQLADRGVDAIPLKALGATMGIVAEGVASYLLEDVYFAHKAYRELGASAPAWKRDAYDVALVLRVLCGGAGDASCMRRGDCRASFHACTGVALLARTPLWLEVVAPALGALTGTVRGRSAHVCMRIAQRHAAAAGK